MASFNLDFVKFWLQTPDSETKNLLIIETTKFSGRLVSLHAPKHFKMIRRYGLYSRRAKKRKIKTFSFFIKMLPWTERIYRDFKRNPLSSLVTSVELLWS